MRIGVTLPAGDEVAAAAAAESVGVTFVHVAATAGAEAAVAAAVAAMTSSVRIVVSAVLADDLPVTIAEEIAVLDNLSNGRIGVIAELGSLAVEAAAEDVTLLRASWSGRPIAHVGSRWRVPAGIDGHVAPPAVMVTPFPAQLELPLWVAGAAAGQVGQRLGLPVVAASPDDVDATAPVAPGRTELSGDVTTDRSTVMAWAEAGATHLACTLPGPAALEDLARWLGPEVGMVSFPRVVAEAPLPLPWPPTDRRARR